MLISQHRKCRNCLGIVKVGADLHKEVAKHSVVAPGGYKFAQVVEEVIVAFAEFVYHVVNICCECLETLFRVKLDDICALLCGNEWFMLSKPEINKLPAAADGVFAVRLD